MYLMTNNRERTMTRKEWLAARLDLLKAERELTQHSDELARRRPRTQGAQRDGRLVAPPRRVQ
jgi:predicted dithiol-disulfide oxidoreductase (DUF899 family)